MHGSVPDPPLSVRLRYLILGVVHLRLILEHVDVDVHFIITLVGLQRAALPMHEKMCKRRWIWSTTLLCMTP